MTWVILYAIIILIEISYDVNMYVSDKSKGNYWTFNAWVSVTITTIVALITLCFQIGSLIYGGMQE